MGFRKVMLRGCGAWVELVDECCGGYKEVMVFFAGLGLSCSISPRRVERPAVPISSNGPNASQGVVLHICHEEGCKIVYVDLILVF